jgi:thioredoxin reductase (NADPH)
MTISALPETVSTDVAIIGAGPVGLFAVFECGMLGMKCRLIDALEEIGGQCTALYPEKPIFDIPALPEIAAGDLVRQLERQITPFQAPVHLNQQVTTLDGSAGSFRLSTSAGTVIEAKAVMIAAGVGAFGPKRPPLDGIAHYETQGAGLGVQYMVRKIHDFAGKRVVIAGGGDSAVDWAIQLSSVAATVQVVHRRAKFRAMDESVRQLHTLADSGAITLVTPFQLERLEGADGVLEAVIVADLDGGERRLEADVLLPFYGLEQSLGPISDWGLNADSNGIPVEPQTARTARAGIYAIGDIAAYPGKLKLILTGFAEAAAAAHHAHGVVFPDKALHFEYSTTKGLPTRP